MRILDSLIKAVRSAAVFDPDLVMLREDGRVFGKDYKR